MLDVRSEKHPSPVRNIVIKKIMQMDQTKATVVKRLFKWNIKRFKLLKMSNSDKAHLSIYYVSTIRAPFLSPYLLCLFQLTRGGGVNNCKNSAYAILEWPPNTSRQKF